MSMKWKDFKKEIESIGINDDTNIRFFVSSEYGDAFELEILDIDDVDRQCGNGNVVDISLLDPPKEYIESFHDTYVQDMADELIGVIKKYI